MGLYLMTLLKPIRLFSIFLLAIAAAACSSSNDKSYTIAETQFGKIRGYVQDSVLIFKGVPYAQAERFMPPHAPERWDTVMDCTRFGCISPQAASRKSNPYIPVDTALFMSENCQNLNIWTPLRKDNDKRPVMVWLHGGAFDYGSSHHHLCFDGYKLANTENVVVVTVNHRLNCLGFLNLEAYGDKYHGSGNAGMADIVAALHWIHDNINAFGGDRDNITLFGHGGGGVKILTLMAMPAAKGLFHKAIIQSGTLEGMTQTAEMSRRVAANTIKNAGVNSAEELAVLPYDSILAASNRAIDGLNHEFKTDIASRIRFAPVVDGILLPKPVFTDTSANVDASIPLIIGSTFSEGATQYHLTGNDSEAMPDVHMLSDEELDAELGKKFGIKKDDVKLAFAMCYPDRPLCEVLMMDTIVRSHVLRMADLLLKRGDAPIYMYLFCWVTPLHNGHMMSFRNSEMPFVFNNPENAEFARVGGTEANRLARIMSRCWASFARSGNPNNSITPFWRRINYHQGHTMIFDRDVRLESYPDLRLMRILQPELVKDIQLD